MHALVFFYLETYKNTNYLSLCYIWTSIYDNTWLYMVKDSCLFAPQRNVPWFWCCQLDTKHCQNNERGVSKKSCGFFFFLIKRTEKFQNLQPFKCFVSFGVFFNFKLRSPLIQQGRKGTRVNASLKPSCHSTPIHVHPLNVGVFVEEKCPFPRTPARPRACAFCVCFLKADKAPLPFPRRELYPQAAAPAPLSQMLLFCHEPFFGQDVTSFPPFVSGWMWMMLFQQYTVARAPRCSLT